MRVDAHVHGLDELRPHLAETNIQRVVLVQSRPGDDETRRLLAVAADELVGAVIGWPDGGAIPRGLGGVRHRVGDAALPDGLAAAGLLCELLVQPDHLAGALDLARRHPDVQLVLAHMGHPPLDGDQPAWSGGMRRLARHPNVAVDLSGILSLAGARWRLVDVAGILDPLVDWFTPNRLMFGSDWPAGSAGGDYADAVQVIEEGLQALDEDEQAAIMGDTAARIHRLG